jgi:tetratricopeptide (TPR) repeat protein
MFFRKKCPTCGKTNPRNAENCASCGTSFELKQSVSRVEGSEATNNYDEAIRLNPQSAEAYYKRGLEYQKLGQQEPAIADFDKAIRIDPQFAKAYCNRGYAYLNKEQYDLAIADCTKAAKLDPKDAVARLNLGVAYKLQGNKAEAIVNFEKAINLSENVEAVEMAKQEIKKLSK